MENSFTILFLIYLNSDPSKKIRVLFTRTTSLSSILSKCKEKFQLNSLSKCILYDLRGDQIAEDDLEYLNPQEPLFLSKGEDFSCNTLKALYDKVKSLGKGGFGTVKLYKNKITKALVAIKFINTKSLFRPEFVSRTYKEIQVLRDLNHPNIVKLMDVIVTTNHICFVMEYCQGGELKQYVNSKDFLTKEEIISFSLQICDAVRYCHNSKVIHRDLKPENIMFKDPNHQKIVIVDFGIAGIFNLGTCGEKSTAGSLYYLAPEVLNGTNNSACPELDI